MYKTLDFFYNNTLITLEITETGKRGELWLKGPNIMKVIKEMKKEKKWCVYNI